MPKPHAVDAADAAVVAAALYFKVNLFLGSGQFDRAEVSTLADAIALGQKMIAAHPRVHSKPMIYAIDAAGAAALVSAQAIAACCLSRRPAA